MPMSPQQLPSDYDYSQCFGIKAYCEQLDPECYLCEYIHACYYAAHASNPDSRAGIVSYERCSYLKDIASPAESFTEQEVVPEDERPEFTRRDLADVLAFLLRQDDYTLGLVAAALQGKALTAAELARHMGVSRQAIHRKLKATCDRCPEIRELLIGNLYRCRRVMRGQKEWTRPNAGTGEQNKPRLH